MPDNTAYYAARAVEERRLAMAAKDANARAVHLDMAARYASMAGADAVIAPADRDEKTA